MDKIKVEALMVQLGISTQKEFVNRINDELKKMGSKTMCVKSYNSRLKNPSLWRIDEANAIKNLGQNIYPNFKIDDIQF